MKIFIILVNIYNHPNYNVIKNSIDPKELQAEFVQWCDLKLQGIFPQQKSL